MLNPRLTVRAAASLATLLVVAGCAANNDVAFDFAASFDLAEASIETELIDIGSAAARPYMPIGWTSDDERWAGRADRTFVWNSGEYSVVRFFVFEPRDVPVEMVGWPNPQSPPLQQIQLVVNGSPLTRIEPLPGSQTYHTTIPSRILRAGENTLAFEYTQGASRGRIEGPGRGSRRFAWDRVAFSDAVATALPRADLGTQPALLLPRSSEANYFLRWPRGAHLTIDSVRPFGPPLSGSSGRLTIVADLVGGDFRSIKLAEVDVAVNHGSLELQLPADAWDSDGDPTDHAEARITFRLEPPADLDARARMNEESGGVLLERPMLNGAAAPILDRSAPSLPWADGDGSTPPNIIVYLVDTLRADHLGAYGYPVPTSPNIDAFAADAVLFERAMAQSAWTRTSIASIFTGLYPRSHDINGRNDSLPDNTATMAQRLRDAGYVTAGFTTNGNVSSHFGFDIGFDDYVHLRETKTAEIHQLSDALNEQAFDWLRRRPPDTPFFLYLHATDPHAPYEPREPFRERFASNLNFPGLSKPREIGGRVAAGEREDARLLVRDDFVKLYDAEIAFNDMHFGRLLDHLRAEGLYDNTIIVLVSDHGEEFYDHRNWEHGKSLYEEQLHVPLIVRFPGSWEAGRRVSELAEHIDILPTLLEAIGRADATTQADFDPATGLDGTMRLPGKSLLAAAVRAGANGQTTDSRPALPYLDLDGRNFDAIVTDRFTLVRHYPIRGAGNLELYDLVADPSQQHNLAIARPALRGYLLNLLRDATELQSHLMTAGEGRADPELRERLRPLCQRGVRRWRLDNY